MEEDIMILESECYYLEELGYLKENNHFIRFNQALKNLIKDYKEKEESEKYLYDAYQDAGKKMFEYAEQLEDSIPKSKIREIIKNWKNQSNYYGSNIIQDLQELLEEE